jgi:hypothetical protein
VFTTLDTSVTQVTEADEGASSDASDDDDLSNLTAKIVALKGRKLSSRRSSKEFDGKFE